MQLIATMVVRSEVLDGGTLVLHFEEGQSLHCYDDSTAYESYRITRKGMGETRPPSRCR